MANIKKVKSVDAVFKRICEDMEWLHAESEKETPGGQSSRARTLFYALAGFLEEREIVDHLKAAALYMQERA